MIEETVEMCKNNDKKVKLACDDFALQDKQILSGELQDYQNTSNYTIKNASIGSIYIYYAKRSYKS